LAVGTQPVPAADRTHPIPQRCTYAQLDKPVRYDLDEILRSPG
jgi:hypothetical protein